MSNELILIERLRKMSRELDMIQCEVVLQAADSIERLMKERDEELERVERLEAEGKRLAVEFEGLLWKEVQSLLDEYDFDWYNHQYEGVSADEAVDYIRETIKDGHRRAEKAEAEVGQLREALKFYADFNRESHDFLIVHRSDKTDVIESVYDMGHRARAALKGGDENGK